MKLNIKELAKKYGAKLLPPDDPIYSLGPIVMSMNHLNEKSSDDTQKPTEQDTNSNRTPEEIEEERLRLVEHAIKFRRENNITGI